MSSVPVLPAVAGAALLLLVVLVRKLRGSSGRGDLMGPPKPARQGSRPAMPQG